ncbi:hypothetical protein KXD93_17770 [Mucilaginibacter sp. BJC16-A38]|uniref:outer membrane beta-barrel protein n=1 Tax=Mucilaginibacter phenanthrenivorans TaxID=1234842 RepID=UPI00215812F7|nr:outer membrane beta-barrel protein [Mucilaginibacter phenanthrenivorans]MCR8559511.1 hypothetical protein [Mucilaginibacter phenanthrenivorans]
MNKFLILIAVFLFTYQFVNAQTEKGNQTLGVNLGFQYSKASDIAVNPGDNSVTTTKTNYNSFNIGPNYSYFIADKLDLGTSLSYSKYLSDNSNNVSNPKTTGHSFQAMVFLRKYFLYDNKIGFRVGPYLAYMYGDSKNTYAPVNSIYSVENKNYNYMGGFNLALVYYPTKKLGVSANIANLEYDHAKNTASYQNAVDNDHGKSNNVYFDFINNGLSLSVFYTFGG